MQLEVKIPKEITEYREKLIFGMGIRQLICVSVALFLGAVTFFCTVSFIGSDLATYLVCAEVMPIMGIGYVRVNGFNFEKYIMIVISHMSKKTIRTYKTELSIDYFDDYNNFNGVANVENELVARIKKERFANMKGEYIKK